MRRMSDDELFGGAGLQPAAAAVDGAEKARLVLAALSDAGLQPPFGMSIESAHELWAVHLNDYDVVDLTAAVTEWIAAGTGRFPTVGHLADLANTARLRRQYGDRPKGRCSTCHDNYFVLADDGDGVVACPDCNPVRRQWQMEGHARPGHDRSSCDHRLCHPAGKRKAATS